MIKGESNVTKTSDSGARLYANRSIPYNMIREEVEGSSSYIQEELTDIYKYYDIYKNGADFTTEGTKGDYVAANQRYKLSKTLIDKEARFLFAEPPDVNVKAKGVNKATGETEKIVNVMDSLVNEILTENNFEDILLKASKDCFIGKRVACLVNFNEEDGVTLTFLPSTQFIHETKMGNNSILTKFVAFTVLRDDTSSNEKRIFKKKYELIDGKVYLNESIHNGVGTLIEPIIEDQEVKLTRIPAIIFINDGLTGEEQGESEIEALKGYESWYSKLSNADKDAERKSMNPTKYTIDMESNSTKDLSSSAGSFWDLQSDQNLPTPNPDIGIMESNMSYTTALQSTLDRIKGFSYEMLDIPQVNLESMQGSITSGKALKAVYWGLIVRCKEKMKMWGPGLREVIEIMIEGIIAYPKSVERLTDELIVPIDYKVEIVQNFPLPEDEVEEKNIDLSEIETKTMSRKTYMKKWYKMTDEEIDDELQQIAMEREVLEDSSFMPLSRTETSQWQQNDEIDDELEGIDVGDA